MSPDSSGTIGKAIAWISLLLAFGAVQGVIYLKSFWGRFGLNPFQYADVDALALVGLTGIGVTLALVGICALFGGYIGSKLASWTEHHKFLIWLVPSVMIATIVILAFLISFGIYLVIGMMMTWMILWLVHRSPEVPTSIKKAPFLPFVVLALTYVPLGSYYFGQREASRVMNSPIKVVVSPASNDGSLRLAGRLGDSYVLYSPKSRTVLVLPFAKVDSLALTP